MKWQAGDSSEHLIARASQRRVRAVRFVNNQDGAVAMADVRQSCNSNTSPIKR